MCRNALLFKHETNIYKKVGSCISRLVILYLISLNVKSELPY
jgi:hypothetical protein